MSSEGGGRINFLNKQDRLQFWPGSLLRYFSGIVAGKIGIVAGKKCNCNAPFKSYYHLY